MIKRYTILLNMIFVTIAVYFGVDAFYKIVTAQLDTDLITKEISKQVLLPVKETPEPLSHYNVIIERNLFNTKTASPQNLKPVNIEGLKKTSLNLKLLGTVSGVREKAYAVVEEVNTRRQNLYRTGDTVQNATVKMILRKKIVLTVNNRDEILMMQEPKSVKPEAESPEPPGVLISKPTRNITLKYSQIEEAIQDVNQLMKDIHIRPYFERGKPGGLILTGVRPRSFFSQLGLRSGDIITGVDGKDIETVDDALEIYEKMKTAANMRLHLKRRGRPEIIDYAIE